MASEPTTRTSTAPTAVAPASAPAAAATQPKAPLALYLLRRGAWSEVGDIPAQFRPERVAGVSLAVLDAHLTLAISGPSRAIRVYTRDGEQWSQPKEVATLGAEAQMKLLDIRGRPALWVADVKSPGMLYFRKGADWDPVPAKLQTASTLQHFDRFALASGLGQLRLLASDGRQRLAEQLYDTNGKLAGEAVEALSVPTETQKRLERATEVIVVTVLLVWMLGALRQRPNLQEAIRRIDSLDIAPLGRRLAGGLVDMVPLLVGWGLGLKLGDAQSPPPVPGELAVTAMGFAWAAGGTAVYFLHITLGELIARRSIGKVLTNTRVASLDGTPARVSQVLIRNLMRIVDIVLMFVPLLSVLSPLRQRVGDMTAGTLVVMNRRGTETAAEAPVVPPVDPDPPVAPT